ncbi:MAG: alpha/beta fold hydrolase [Pauljensenia sp.]
MPREEVLVPRGPRALRVLVRRERPRAPGDGGMDEGGAGGADEGVARLLTSATQSHRGGGTVLLEAGLGLDSSLWHPLLDLIDADRRLDDWRIVASDRAGLGASNLVPDPRPLSSLTTDMDAVVAALVSGPLVLVGHSWGGTLVRLWCAAHPGSAVGAVLVDASYERGPEHHRSSSLGWLGRGVDVLATDALEALQLSLGQNARESAHARTQEMRLFGTSLDLLESLESRGHAWMPDRMEVVTTSRRHGRQLEAQQRYAQGRGFTLRAATTRHHLIPLRDPATTLASLVDVLPRE